MNLSVSCLLFLLNYSIAQNTSTTNSQEKVVVAYYQDWAIHQMKPDQIKYSQITHLYYAFAIPNKSHKLVIKNEHVLKQIVEKAHKNNVKAVLSVGGWGGSAYFSKIVSSEDTRKDFVNQLHQLIAEYDLDGIDLDWEYPGQGREGVLFDKKNDAKNFIKLFKKMRSKFDNKVITLPVKIYPIKGPNASMSELSQYVDFINIMSFDMYGPWSNTTGPNAPLHNALGRARISFEQSWKDWVAFGFPKDKIVMGVPFYGRESGVLNDMSLNINNIYQKKPKKGPHSTPSWKELRSEGILATPLEAGAGWQRFWDNETKTPWLFNKEKKKFISYDDGESISYKVKYILEQELKGLMVWSLEKDNGELISEVAKVLSRKEQSESNVEKSGVDSLEQKDESLDDNSDLNRLNGAGDLESENIEDNKA